MSLFGPGHNINAETIAEGFRDGLRRSKVEARSTDTDYLARSVRMVGPSRNPIIASASITKWNRECYWPARSEKRISTIISSVGQQYMQTWKAKMPIRRYHRPLLTGQIINATFLTGFRCDLKHSWVRQLPHRDSDASNPLKWNPVPEWLGSWFIKAFPLTSLSIFRSFRVVPLIPWEVRAYAACYYG